MLCAVSQESWEPPLNRPVLAGEARTDYERYLNSEELLALHRETRRQRNAAAHGTREHVAAIRLLSRIEVEVARIERAMDPPLG